MAEKNRWLAILDLFESDLRVLTVEFISVALSISLSTAYRSVAQLCKAGFLDRVSSNGYALGSAFIHYDYVLRQKDPLIQAAKPVMALLLSQTLQSATVILCKRYRDCIMCVHEEHGKEQHLPASYERGMEMPIFLGATSKVILAHLPDRILKKTYLNHESTIQATTNVHHWKDFKNQLNLIKKQGYAQTESEVTNNITGIAAPIIRDDKIIGGVSLVFSISNTKQRKAAEQFPPHVIAAGQRISANLNQ